MTEGNILKQNVFEKALNNIEIVFRLYFLISCYHFKSITHFLSGRRQSNIENRITLLVLFTLEHWQEVVIILE